MKLVNKDITYVLGHEMDDVLGPVYKEEREYQGSKQHMRLRWNRKKVPTMEWYDDLGHNRHEIYNLIDKFIRKRVGQKFDDVYSEFLKDPRFKDSKVSWNNRPRDIFNEYICEDKRFGRRNTWRDAYIVDSEGRIQLNPDKPVHKKNRDLVIRVPYEERELRYEINHKNVFRLRDIIIEHWGWNKYLMLVYNDYLSSEVYDANFFKLLFSPFNSRRITAMYEAAKNIRGCFPKYHYFSYKSTSTIIKDLLFRERYAPLETYKYGTRAYFIKRAEIKQQQRKAYKARKHPDRSDFDRTLMFDSHPSLEYYYDNPQWFDLKQRGKSLKVVNKYDKTRSE